MSDGIEFFRRRLAEVEQFSADLDKRSDLVGQRAEFGVYVCALAIRQVASELVRLQLAFNSVSTVNAVEIPDKTRDTLRQSRAALTELEHALDTVIQRHKPRHSDIP